MDQLLTLKDGLVVLTDERGSIEVPSALRTYALLSSGGEKVDGVRMDEQLRSLRIGTERADVRLVLSVPVDAGGTIIAAPQVRTDGGWADVSVAVVAGADHAVVRGQWLALDDAALHDISSIANDHGLTWPARVSLRQYLTVLMDAERAWVVQDLTSAELTAERIVAQDDAPMPDVGVALYPYQVVGVRWLRRVVAEGLGGILADEMGLGKTLQIIALIQLMRDQAILPVLIVGPTTILENWRRELVRFAPSLDVLVHQGADRTGDPGRLFAHDVVVSSYETVLRDEILLRQRQWGLVVADEAQALKNPETERSRCLRRLPRRVALAVSGTPLENRLRDLWSLADFATPDLLGDVADFRERYEGTAEGAMQVGRIMAPLMLRRRTAEVATDLPELIDIPQFVTLSEAEAQAYDRLRAQFDADGGNGRPRPQLAMLTTLLQFCSHPILAGADDWHIEDGSKFTRLVEILSEAIESGEKVLIFASYQRMINLLSADVVTRFGVPVFELYGETPVKDRQTVVDRFSEVVGPAVLVLNPRAGGVGLNITAASQVVHYSAEWNPAVIDQATKRAHRRGQKRVVRVHRLLCVGTIDEVVNERVIRKRELAAKAVVGTDGSEDDLSDLVRAIAISPGTAV